MTLAEPLIKGMREGFLLYKRLLTLMKKINFILPIILLVLPCYR